MIGCLLKSCGVNTRRPAAGEFASKFLFRNLSEICLFDVFESTKVLVTMERAVFFKRKNYGKLILDVFVGKVSNHKWVVDVLCKCFSFKSAKLEQLMKINVFMTFPLR